ncbi:hypothetical protein PVAG01_01462 [Phlyctema vagabunda]|uniref:Uncharacterized protein n=1 Tax=Phlyctema vagabunda TaxID=108571 RepID=A0ABR4PX68_9HELO
MTLSYLSALLPLLFTLVRGDSITTSRHVSIVVQPPPPQWSAGEPYTTVPLYESKGAATPTWEIVTITTSILVLPTVELYVATGSSVSPAPANPTYFYYNQAQTLDGIPGYVYLPLREEDVEQSTAFTIDLKEVPYTTRCWYPVSGNYGRLPRILFYVTIAAAVVLRTHLPWLYIGALAASLTYSGSAAIHACLLVWRGPAWGELDIYALLAILSVSCITMVPLINWSSTIRTAGRPDLQSREHDERPKVIKEIDASARIILICWSFLVTVGFLTAFLAFQDRTEGSRLGHWQTFVRSGQQSLSCTPPKGFLNVTAGQPLPYDTDGHMSFNGFIVTQEFVDVNNCQNPCSDPVGGVAIFRTEADLTLLSMEDNTSYLAYHSTSSSERERWTFILGYSQKWSYLIIYVLLEGIWTVCFGRSKPSQIRTILYGYFSRIHLSGLDPNRYSQRRHSRRFIAQAIALVAYSWSLFIVLIAIPLLIVDVVVIELYMRGLPQSENSKHIGSWTPYASVGLVLLGVAIAKTYTTIKAVFLQTGSNVWKLQQILRQRFFKTSLSGQSQTRPRIEHGSYIEAFNKGTLVVKATGEFVFGIRFLERAKRELNDFIFFIKHPDEDWETYDKMYGAGGTGLSPVCECPEDFSCKAHPMCSHSRKCKDDTKCKDCKVCDGKVHYLHHDCICMADTDHFVGVSMVVGHAAPKVDGVQVSNIGTGSAESRTQGGIAGGSESLPLRDLNTRQNSLPQMSTPDTTPQQGIPARSSTTPVRPQHRMQQQDSTRRLLSDQSF